MRVERLNEEHMEQYSFLSRIEFGDHAAVSNANHLRWKFLQNPQGPSFGIHLYQGSELVGRMVALTRAFTHRHRLYKAAHIVDFLVHPKARGMAALLNLTRGLRQLSGFDFFLIMAPNPAGAAVWENFWKMPRCFDLDVLAAPLRPASASDVLGKLRSGPFRPLLDSTWTAFVRLICAMRGAVDSIQVDREWPSSPEIENLTTRREQSDYVFGIRTPDYLDWRYRRSPVFRYEVFFLRKDGQLMGYIVTRKTTFEGLDCLFIVDAFCSPELSPKVWLGAIAPSIKTAIAEHAHLTLTMGNVALEPLSSLRRLPFVTVPARLLPRRTGVYAEWISPPAFEIRRENSYFALGDSDVI